MLEYIFFHENPYRQFVSWLEEKGVKPEVFRDAESYVVGLPEDLDDDLGDDIDERYDQLLDSNRELVAADECTQGDFHLAGIAVTLQDGTVSYAGVDPGVMGKIMGVISPDDFSKVVEAIVQAVESPQSQSPCQRRDNK